MNDEQKADRDDYHERVEYEEWLLEQGLLKEPVAGEQPTTLTRIVLEKEGKDGKGSV